MAVHTKSKFGENEVEDSGWIVLCQECYEDHFSDPELDFQQREWLSLVALEKVRQLEKQLRDQGISWERLLTLTEAFRENQEYELLSFLYHLWGNVELRDKYVERALAGQPSKRAEVFLRSLQGRLDRVDKSSIEAEIERLAENEDWVQVARIQLALGQISDAVESYCRGVRQALTGRDPFSAAEVLREIGRKDLPSSLLEDALRESAEKDRFWWEIRSLSELGWDEDLREYIQDNFAIVEKSEDLFLKQVLYQMRGDDEKSLETATQIAKNLRSF